MNAEDIKAWLQRNGRDREWLANECRVAKTTVDGWISNNRPIPGPAERVIESLMEGPITPQPPTVAGLDIDLLFKLDAARNVAGYRTLKEFWVSALDNAADEILEKGSEESEEPDNAHK